MTREDYLKILIKKYGSQREFAQYIGMPHSTLFSILRNVGGASMDNITKICKGLGITIDDLANISEDGHNAQQEYYVDETATEFVEYLRTHPGARMLFTAVKDIRQEDLVKAVEYIELLKLKNK